MRHSFGVLWLAFLAEAFLFAPRQMPEFDRYLALGVLSGQYSGLPMTAAMVFSVLGVWPFLLACYVLPYRKKFRPTVWPFWLGTFAFGAGAILPYLWLRRPKPGSKSQEETGFLGALLDSRYTKLMLGLIIVAGLAYGFWIGDARVYWHLWQRSQLVHVMTIDLLILSFLVWPALHFDTGSIFDKPAHKESGFENIRTYHSIETGGTSFVSNGNQRAIVLVGPEFEDSELMYPMLRLKEAGLEVVLAGIGKDTYAGKRGQTVTVQGQCEDFRDQNWDLVVVPGGWAPDKVRTDTAALDIVRQANSRRKVVAAICHAGWVLASADIVRGRTLTSYPGIRDDLVNAGASWVDEEVVVDGNLVTSRRPDDLPAFCRAILKCLEQR